MSVLLLASCVRTSWDTPSDACARTSNTCRASDYHQQCVNTPGGPIGNELEIRSLRYFVVAAEELNFTRAAARLYVAQQALSREIKRLETQLGTTLFVRTTRRVTLDAGWRAAARQGPGPRRAPRRGLGRCSRARRATDGGRPHEWRTAHGDPDPRPGARPSAKRRLPRSLRRRDRGRAREPRDRRPRRRPRPSRLARCAAPMPTIDQVLVRLEPLAVLLPAAHPLARAGSGPGSRPAGASRSMACRRIRTRPNGPT